MKTPPLYYALAGLLACPFYALAFVAAGLLLLLLTPVAPFILYAVRKDELAKGDCNE